MTHYHADVQYYKTNYIFNNILQGFIFITKNSVLQLFMGLFIKQLFVLQH